MNDMNWIRVEQKPEDLFQDYIKTDFFGEEFIECLAHTNKGHFIAKRIHEIKTELLDFGDNEIGKEVKDYGWYWDIEVGNSIKINPIYIDYWCLITETP